jgi:hypothetical protein
LSVGLVTGGCARPQRAWQGRPLLASERRWESLQPGTSHWQSAPMHAAAAHWRSQSCSCIVVCSTAQNSSRRVKRRRQQYRAQCSLSWAEVALVGGWGTVDATTHQGHCSHPGPCAPAPKRPSGISTTESASAAPPAPCSTVQEDGGQNHQYCNLSVVPHWTVPPAVARTRCRRKVVQLSTAAALQWMVHAAL